MLLARRFNWTAAQIDATDPDLIDELLTFVRAENDDQRIRAEQAAQR